MTPRVFLLVMRLLVAIGGGYAATSGLTAMASIALPTSATLPRGDAVVMASMLAFPVYLAILIWAFAERRIVRLGIVLAGIGAASWGGALGLMRLTGGS